MKRWDAIIKQYQLWKKSNPDVWIQDCVNQTSLIDAINLAARSENSQGKRHKHQYRLKSSDLKTFSNELIKNHRAISNAKDFKQLITEVNKCKVAGIGELAVYDTAVRIGAYLQIEPQEIYLHAGTRLGVNKLLQNVTGDTIKKANLPEPFKSSTLSCYELEDLLCIYKDKL